MLPPVFNTCVGNLARDETSGEVHVAMEPKAESDFQQIICMHCPLDPNGELRKRCTEPAYG